MAGMRKAAMCLMLWASLSASAATFDGAWEITITRFGEPNIFRRATLKTAGEKLTGQSGDVKIEGTTHGDSVKLEVRQADGKVLWDLSGTLVEDVLVGTGTMFDSPATWTARHPAARPAGEAKAHRFTPRTFHRQFSSSIQPVMHLFPGDSVSTWTVDAGGKDASEQQRSLGGNPVTGPFYWENAWP